MEEGKMKDKTEFRSYIDANQSLPPDCILGHIVWFTVEDAPYDAGQMAKDFDRLNLNADKLPPRIKPDDAFEKASKEIHGFTYKVVGGNSAEILVREVARDTTSITRHMIREVKDSKGRRLLYERVGEFVFYRAVPRNGQLDYSSARVRCTLDPSLSPSEHVMLEPLVNQFEAAYLRFRDFHDGQKIRGVLRNYLTYLNAVQMKPSVYFCPQSRADELERLKEWTDGLHTASMMLLPQADLPRLRRDVIDAFQAEAEKDLAQVVTEIQKLRDTRSKGVRPEAYVKVKQEYDRVMLKASEYGRTLQIGQDRTAGAAELAVDALMALQIDVVKGMNSNA
jgi:hypothetical protein